MADTLYSLELLIRNVDLEKFVKHWLCVDICHLLQVDHMFSLAYYFSLVLVGPYVTPLNNGMIINAK